MSVFSLPVHAVDQSSASVGDIRPMFSYIVTMAHYFDINNMGKATCEALMNAFDADKLMVEVELQQYDLKTYKWKTIKTWTKTTIGDDSCGAGGSWYVMSGNMYRSVARGYVYVNGELVEDHEMISSVKVYE